MWIGYILICETNEDNIIQQLFWAALLYNELLQSDLQ